MAKTERINPISFIIKLYCSLYDILWANVYFIFSVVSKVNAGPSLPKTAVA